MGELYPSSPTHASSGQVSGHGGASSLYDDHMAGNVDQQGRKILHSKSFMQVTPSGAESTPWKVHFSVDPGHEGGDLKRSWEVFNRVVDSDPSYQSAFKVTKPETALRHNDPNSLQAGKQITYYVPEDMKPDTLQRFVSTVEGEFKDAGIKPGPRVNFDRPVPGSSGFSSYRSDIVDPKYTKVAGEKGNYLSANGLQSVEWAIEDGDPAVKHLKTGDLYNLSGKPDPFRQVEVTKPAPVADAPQKAATAEADRHVATSPDGKTASTQASHTQAESPKAAASAKSSFGKAASRAQAGATVLKDAATGDYGKAAAGAGITVGLEALQSKKVADVAAGVGAAAIETAEKNGGLLSKLAGGAKQIVKRIPGFGALVTGGFVAAEVANHISDGEFKKAGIATVAGIAETAGNAVGFGVGDAAREGVRGIAIAAGGPEIAKSGLRDLGEGAVELVRGQISPSRSFNGQSQQPADASPPVSPSGPAQRPRPTPGKTGGLDV